MFLTSRSLFRRKKEILSWALFDFANSSYSIIILSFVFPLFFRDVISGGGSTGDFYWGLVISISTLLGGLLTPLIGASADYDKQRKRKFILFTLFSIAGTALLALTGEHMLLVASLLFIATNVFFEISQTLYNSFLPQISTKKTTGTVSGLGWGLGYVGGICALLLFKPLYTVGKYELTFLLTSVFFLFFSLPAFFLLRQKKVRGRKQSFKQPFSEIASTFREVKAHKNIFLFLIALYILSDGLTTFFSFSVIYMRTTLQFTLQEIGVFVVLTQLIAFPSTLFFGWLSDKVGMKKILLFTILCWIGIISLMALITTKTLFFVVASAAGLVVGASQSVARSWLSVLIPYAKRGQFFGLSSFATKMSALTGPILFGTVSLLTGSQRVALLALLPFFFVSFILFLKVKE